MPVPTAKPTSKSRSSTRAWDCLLGCDALFELGYVFVEESGVIEVGKPGPNQVADRIKGLVGRKCLAAHDNRSSGYFDWHRQDHAGKLVQ